MTTVEWEEEENRDGYTDRTRSDSHLQFRVRVSVFRRVSVHVDVHELRSADTRHRQCCGARGNVTLRQAGAARDSQTSKPSDPTFRQQIGTGCMCCAPHCSLVHAGA